MRRTTPSSIFTNAHQTIIAHHISFNKKSSPSTEGQQTEEVKFATWRVWGLRSTWPELSLLNDVNKRAWSLYQKKTRRCRKEEKCLIKQNTKHLYPVCMPPKRRPVCTRTREWRVPYQSVVFNTSPSWMRQMPPFEIITVRHFIMHPPRKLNIQYLRSSSTECVCVCWQAL